MYVCVCVLARIRAVSVRVCETGATGAPFFPPSVEGWNSFRGPTPSTPTNGTAVRLLRLSLPYSSKLIPSAVPRPLPTLGVCFFPSISIHRSRPATSKNILICVLRRELAVAKIHRRRCIQKSQMDLIYVGEVAGGHYNLLKFTKEREKIDYN